MLHAIELVRELVALPGPPGQEDAVRRAVAAHVDALGFAHETDARGNLLVAPGQTKVPERADIVVMAHLDEIALLVTRVGDDGRLSVAPLGGLLPYKWGEGTVSILTPKGPIDGVLGFGSIHTNDPASNVVHARDGNLNWGMARVFTGRDTRELAWMGVRPGTRVCLHPSRRIVTQMGEFVSSFFLDDRADLAAWLLVLAQLAQEEKAAPPAPQVWPLFAGPQQRGEGEETISTGSVSQGPLGQVQSTASNLELPPPKLGGPGGPSSPTIVFAATAAEEVGGHGALYLLRRLQPTVGIALELGPRVPDAPIPIDDQPTVWVNDGYAAMQPADTETVARAAKGVGLRPHYQALSRGGSDASCAAAAGLIARPITLAFGCDNSHGAEIMHAGAVDNLALLTRAVLDSLTA